MPHPAPDLVRTDLEVLHPPTTYLMWGWRHHGVEMTYRQDTILVGGPWLMAATALTSAVVSRRRRLEAERMAAPQWRPLGVVAVTVLDQCFIAAPMDLPAGLFARKSIVEVVRISPSEVDVHIAADFPFRFAGEEAGALAIQLGG